MKQSAFFVPMLSIDSGVTDISFYSKAFNATELRRFNNDDGSVHVAELLLDGALLHLHEQTPRFNALSPGMLKGTTVTIGLMTGDPDQVVEQAVSAGATLSSPVQDYDYGYRQGEIIDPFGHRWIIETVTDQRSAS